MHIHIYVQHGLSPFLEETKEKKTAFLRLPSGGRAQSETREFKKLAWILVLVREYESSLSDADLFLLSGN